jgi:hypothetical protein
MAALVIVDTRLTGCIDQDFGDHARGSLWGAQNLYEGHEQRNDEFRHKAHEGAGIARESRGRVYARLDRVEVQPRSLSCERHRRGEDGLLGRRVRVKARPLRAAGFPFPARARLGGDVAATARAGGLGGLVLGIFHGRGDEDDVRTIREMRQKRLGQRERAEVVRRESHVPAARVLRRAHLHDARVVEQADDRQIQRDDLRRRAPHTGKIRQVAHDRHCVLPFSLDGLDAKSNTVLRQPSPDIRWVESYGILHSAFCDVAGPALPTFSTHQSISRRNLEPRSKSDLGSHATTCPKLLCRLLRDVSNRVRSAKLLKSGAPEGIRTSDLCLRRAMLHS